MEVWKPIKGYDNYWISNLGCIQNKYIYKNKGKSKNGILTNYKSSAGYKVTLYNNGIGKDFKVEKLLAENFIANPHNYIYVGFKDFNKHNISLENLQWIDNKYLVLPGMKFNNLTYIKVSDKQNYLGVFKCDCGKKVEKNIIRVKGNYILTCGCKNTNKNKSILITKKIKNKTEKENNKNINNWWKQLQKQKAKYLKK